MSQQAIHIQDLTFHYAGHSGPGIDHFNLHVEEGKRFGLFGPNGAGKTTIMNLMTGLLKYNSGSIQIFGQELNCSPKSLNKLFGFVPQDFSFYPELSPRENLAFYGAWYKMSRKQIFERSEELLEILGLSSVGDKMLKEFSGGMKRRVNLAIGVLHQPRILFLDEPTVGVDVQSRHAIIYYLKNLNKGGTTLVYTSHQLEEADELC